MTDFLFLFGNSSQLSLLELQIVLKRLQLPLPYFSTPSFALVNLESNDSDISGLQDILGGTVKIYKLVKPVTKDTLLSELSTFLETLSYPDFSLSQLNYSINLESLGMELKQISRKMSFRVLTSPQTSAGSITKYTDLLIVNLEHHLTLFQAISVQDFKTWSHLDYDRPGINPHRGMLPPKIARIMLNFGLPNKLTSDIVIYDPFCGSGTILIEGLRLGVKVIGSDLSPKSVAESQDNISWFESNLVRQSQSPVFVANAANLNPQNLNFTQVDAIVFEGFLGPPHLKKTEIKNLHKGLYKLYLGSLKRFLPLLKDSGRVICALPEFRVEGLVKNFDDLIDTCEKYGYTQVEKPVYYARPDALVARKIYLLQKTKINL